MDNTLSFSARVLAESAAEAKPGIEADPARSRLLHAALALFAEQGFAKTSVREIAQAAQVNVAAINYYFRDKAGLYEAAFFEPMGCDGELSLAFADPTLSMPAALRALFEMFLSPLRHADFARQRMKLRLREMLDATGLWQQEIHEGILPIHHALTQRICAWLQLPGVDAAVHRLAQSVLAMGVHLHIAQDVIQAIDPQLVEGDHAWDRWQDQCVAAAVAMIQAEQSRRSGVAT